MYRNKTSYFNVLLGEIVYENQVDGCIIHKKAFITMLYEISPMSCILIISRISIIHFFLFSFIRNELKSRFYHSLNVLMKLSHETILAAFWNTIYKMTISEKCKCIFQ